MSDGIGAAYLRDVRESFNKLRNSAERATAQVGDDAFFATLDADANSIALVMKHMAGNLRSRFTDFLTEDGEKPDRDRDAEFEIRAGDTRQSIEAAWRDGWAALALALDGVTERDLLRTVRIRGEGLTVLQALDRQLTHHAYHVGQIVLLAKHLAGPRWKTLTIPRGQSQAFNARMQGKA